MWWLSTLALAAGPDAFPLAAEVQVPETGPTRIAVPLELRTRNEPNDGRGFRIENALGEVVPYAVYTSDVQGEVLGVGSELSVTPQSSADTYVLSWRGNLDALSVRPTDFGSHHLMSLFADGSAAPFATVPIYKNDFGTSDPTPVPAGTQRIRVEIRAERGDTRVKFEGLDYPEPWLPPIRLDVPAVGPELLESQVSRWIIPEARDLPVRKITLQPTQDLLNRRAVAVRQDQFARPDELTAPIPGTYTPIERNLIDGRSFDRTSLTVQNRDQRNLAVYVEDTTEAPLDIPSVTLHLPALELIVRDPGPGPLTVFAGAPDAADPTSELQSAVLQLARLAGDPIPTSDPGPNPAYVPVESATELGEPARALDVSVHTHRADVTGPAGLVELPLSAEWLAISRPDLRDLRLATHDERGIPFLLQRSPVAEPSGPLPMERSERGSDSYIEVDLPQSGARVGTVVLQTDAPLFDRPVRIERVNGSRLVPVRAVNWSSTSQGSTLRLSLNRIMGDTLVVVIDNGDDRPLPVTSVTTHSPRWSMLAVLPPDGAVLWGGGGDSVLPSYDLELLSTSLERRAKPLATVGPPQSNEPEPPSSFDRFVIGIGIGVMALVLLALLLLLVLRGPVVDEADEAEGDDEEDAPAQDEVSAVDEDPVEEEPTP